jgi:hypothetical protein
VVNTGVTDERTSFHSLSWIIVNILRKTLRLTEKVWKKKINNQMPFTWICKTYFWSRTYSTIDEVVEIFHENRFDKIDVSRVKIRQSSVEITKGSAVLCGQFLVVFRNVLPNNLILIILRRSLSTFKNSFYLFPHTPHVTEIRQGFWAVNSLWLKIVERRSPIPNNE